MSSPAQQAFDRGDFAEVRRLARAEGADEETRKLAARLGYDPVISDGFDAFAVDMAIIDPGTGLYGIGIECDAPRHDILARARARELWRPGVLAGTMRRLHRVSCVDWYERRGHEEKRLRAAIAAALSNAAGSAA